MRICLKGLLRKIGAEILGNIGKYWEISRYLPFGSGARIDIAMKNKYNSTV